MILYLPGCALITFATPNSTCDGDKLSGSMSSSSSASKAVGDVKASETLSLRRNLCGLVTLYNGFLHPAIHAMTERCHHVKTFRRLFRRIFVVFVAFTLAALPWLRRCSCFYRPRLYRRTRVPSVTCKLHYARYNALRKLEEPEATLTCCISAKTSLTQKSKSIFPVIYATRTIDFQHERVFDVCFVVTLCRILVKGFLT